MSQRKFNFDHLTEEQLDALAKKYPKSVEVITLRKPVYRQLAMLAECGAELPEGVVLEPPAAEVAAQTQKATQGELPAMYKQK